MSSLLARRAARTAILSKGASEGTTSGVFAKGADDPTKTLEYLTTLPAGSTINAAKRRGPILTFTRASSGTNFDENKLLVTAATNAPRFHHDPVTGAALGLLPEGQRANEIIRSQEFDNGSWVKNISVSANSTVAPDGTTTADTLTDDDGGAAEICRQSVTVGNSETYTNTVYILKDSDETRFPALRLSWLGGTTELTNDLQLNTSTGAVTFEQQEDGTSIGSVEDAGDWWRLRLTSTNNASGNTELRLGIFPASGTVFGTESTTATGSIIAWGAQTEEAAFPTSYIPTTTAAVTRSADVDSANISSQLGSANTLFVAARTGFGAGVVCQIDDGTENERFRIERNASNEIHVIVTDGGVGQADLNLGSVADLTDFKVAVRLDTNDFAASLDGAAVVTDTSGSLPTVDTIRFGMDTANDEWNGPIAQGKLFNVGKPNAFLQSITA